MFLRLFTACGSEAGGSVAAFPGKDKAEVGLGSRLASSLGPPPFSIFGLGWRRLVYFMQNVMANEVATSWPGRKERETKGRGGQD